MTEDSVRVSIIIPVYNSENYLEECLKSILALDSQDYEVLLIDDGSTDRSPEILRKFAALSDRFRIITQKNQGASAARNRGVAEACGEYVCFVDSDDIVYENMLKDMLECIGDAQVCIGKKTRWNQIKDFKRTDGWKAFRGSVSELHKVLRRYKRSMRGATGRLYRTDVIRDNNIRFRPELRYGEDMRFNYDYFRYIDRVAFCDKVVYLYRIHNLNSLSSVYAPHFLKQWKTERECVARLYK